jgi:hypothetical protein
MRSDDYPDYFISDSSPQNEASARILQLHVVSMGNIEQTFQSFQTFLQDKLNTHFFLFPPFSREEHLWCKRIRNAAGSWTNEEELQLRYDVFGGSIRLLHTQTPPSQVPVELQQFAYRELITFFKNVRLGRVGANVPVTTQLAKLFVEFSMTVAANLNEMNGNPLKMRTFFQHCVLNEDGFLLRIPSSKFMSYLETIVIPK